MKILSLDQAAKIGWCYTNDSKRMKYGTEDFGRDKKMDYNHKVHEVKKYVKKLIKQYEPDLVTLESIYAMNKDTYKKV